jgi:N-acetylneuraminic acid mutarotase
MTRKFISTFGTSRTFRQASLLAIGIIAVYPALAQTSGTWKVTGAMNEVRIYHTATLLPNGEVLAAGGSNSTAGYLDSAELYNPATGKWTLTGGLQTAREGHVATLLQNGLVLVTGGIDASGNITASAELYNPATRTFTATGNMRAARYDFTATLLLNGEVLAAGGANEGRGGLSSAELYNPATETWTSTGRMTTGRFGQTATLLEDGDVLVAGSDSAELYNPATGSWTAIGTLPDYHQDAFAMLLRSGQVLIVGGDAASLSELFDPSVDTFTAVAAPCRCTNLAAAILRYGRVLAAGGTTGYHPVSVNSAEVYDPSTQSWLVTGSMSAPRDTQAITPLSNGQALVTGGEEISGGRATELASAEVYTP